MISRLAVLLSLLIINPLVSSTRASDAAAASASASTSCAAEEAESLPYTPAAAAVTASASASSAAAAHAFGDFTLFPSNVIRKIGSYLSPKEIPQMGRTCKEGEGIIPDLYKAHLLSRLRTFQDTGVLPSDLSQRYLRDLKRYHPEMVKDALSDVFNPPKETVFSVPSSAAFLFSDVPEIDSLDSDTLRDRLHAALTSAAEPGHAWGEWQDIALTHFLSDITLYKKGAVTDAEVARVVASLVPEFHACEYVPLAAYLTGSAGTPVATKAEVRAHKDALNARLADNPDQRVVIDLPIETGEDGTPVVSMSIADIPANLRNLAIVTRARTPYGVSDRFLCGGDRLTKLTLALRHAEWLGHKFLKGCKGLPKLILRLPNAIEVGDEFLARCTGLIFFAPYLPNVTEAGDSFLSNCAALPELTLSMPNFTEVGDAFLINCFGLLTLDLALPRLRRILTYGDDATDGFLCQCSALREFILNLPELDGVRGRFLSNCTALRTLILNLLGAYSADEVILEGCYSLRELTVKAPMMTDLEWLVDGDFPALTTLSLLLHEGASPTLAEWRTRHPTVNIHVIAQTDEGSRKKRVRDSD